MSSFSCPHLVDDYCRRLREKCDPGLRGCVLHGRVVFAERPEKNPSPEEVERAKRRVAKRSSHRPRP